MDARLNFDAEPPRRNGGRVRASRDPEARVTIDGIDPELLKPASKNWDARPDLSRWLAREQVSLDPRAAYLIDGWLAQCGTSVWFGAGSTGKTQLMLWMAGLLACLPEDRRQETWLGGKVNGTGHVLVLTAEDTREQVMLRLMDVLEHTLKLDAGARARTCDRLHLMPFLSMSEDAFKHASPSLFQQNQARDWEPSKVLEEVRRYILVWNLMHSNPDDRIIGVVMDSATSMAGFDSLDAQATTNFFFYLGRLCERLRIFWTIIGHTPKATTISRLTYRATAASRLRGVAMWTTAPRLVVEVRLVQNWSERGKRVPEAQKIRDFLNGYVEREDLLKVYVAKANLQHATREERVLARQRRGAFADVTEMPQEVLTDGTFNKREPQTEMEPEEGAEKVSQDPSSSRRRNPSSTIRGAPKRRGRRGPTVAQRTSGTELVLELVRSHYPAGGSHRRVSANRLKRAAFDLRGSDPRADLVLGAYGGGEKPVREGSINWHLERLVERGVLEKQGGHFHLAPPDRDREPPSGVPER